VAQRFNSFLAHLHASRGSHVCTLLPLALSIFLPLAHLLICSLVCLSVYVPMCNVCAHGRTGRY